MDVLNSRSLTRPQTNGLSRRKRASELDRLLAPGATAPGSHSCPPPSLYVKCGDVRLSASGDGAYLGHVKCTRALAVSRDAQAAIGSCLDLQAGQEERALLLLLLLTTTTTRAVACIHYRTMLLTRGSFALVPSVRAKACVFAQTPYLVGTIRANSNGDRNNSLDDSSAQKKLDELADFLESRPQEAQRSSRSQRPKPSQAQSDQVRTPTKVFQNGHVRILRERLVADALLFYDALVSIMTHKHSVHVT